MVRRAQMQKQMDISSTKADKLLKKAKKMNNRMFNEGGVKMTKKGEDPFKGDKPTGKKDKKGLKQYKRPDGSTYFRLPGGDEKRNVGGILDLLKPSMGAATGSGQSIEQKGMPRRIKKIKPKEQKGMPKRTKKIELKEKKLSEGGALKAIPSENKGLPNLPKEVRNKMGYMKDGGTARSNNAKKSRGAGAMIKGTTFRGVY